MAEHEVIRQYPQWLIDMLQSFCDMRDAQKDYFAQKSDYRMQVAKAKEKAADAWIERAVAKGIIAHRTETKTRQSKLF